MLGRGGQAVVYKAVQESTRRVVAVKLLREGPLASSSQRMRFVREINLVSQLDHPNIARIYESGVLRGHYWFSMECISDGEPIDDYVLLNRPDVQRVVRLIGHVARAVGYAHQQGVIHRDLKPSNILVDPGGVPHVVDFGLAKEVDQANTGVSLEGQLVGTLPYLSPEQVADSGARADVRSDVYALGLVLYQLLTGGYPYPMSDSPFVTREHILRTEPIRPRKMQRASRHAESIVPSGEISDDLEKIILRAMAKDRNRRYQTMFEFADDLQRYIHGEAIEAKSDDYWYNLRKTLRRYRKQAIVAGLCALVLGASLAFSISMWHRAERVAHIAQSGLDAVAYNALGSSARDLGRRDDAIELFKASIDISEITDLHDPTLLAARFDACYRTAWMLYREGDFDRANELRDAAAAALKRALTTRLDNSYWKRKQRALHLLDGLRAKLSGDNKLALAEFEVARDIGIELLSEQPENTMVMRDLALSLRWIGDCLLDLNCHDEALIMYQESQRISTQILLLAPVATDDLLDTVRCRHHQARCLSRRKLVQDDVSAIALLYEAKELLDVLETERPHHGLERDAKSLHSDIDRLFGFIEARLVNRAASKPSHSSTSSSVPTGSSPSSKSG
ncbi:MAG TPA: serine/threonine-protein kinase [Phycisphaerae bacterium]|nr:serine/threonine-protein kinase [Phycisphaerae bacterium]